MSVLRRDLHKESMMPDGRKTKTQLIGELRELRQRISLLESGKKSGDSSYALHTIDNEGKRKRIESELREAKERAQRYLDIAEVIFIALDINQNITLINPKGCQVLGYSKEELLGKNWFEHFLPAEHLDDVKNVFNRIISGELDPVEYYENSVLIKGGSERIIAWHNSILRDDAGKITGLFSSGMDITEKKRTEEALLASEERWKSLAENAAGFVTILNRNHVIEYINNPVSGIEHEDVIGHSVYDFIQPEYHNIARRSIESVFATGRHCGYESVAEGPDGTLAFYDNRLGPVIVGGQIVAVSIFGTDITEQKQAEDRLKESEQKFRVITEGSADAIYITDMKGKYVYVNKASCEMLGYSREELLGMSISDLSGEDKIDESQYMFQQLLETGGIYGEIELRRKDGVFIPVDLNAVTLTDGLVYGSCRNISERKLAEDKIRNSLQKKEVMLKEIHHRVKNNMQIISSLINLQTEGISDQSTIDKLKACRRRIKAMALVHEGLYEASDLSRIDFSSYIRKMTTHIFSAYSLLSNRVELKVDVKNIFLDINTAIPCGLIIDELVSNALEHGFPEGRAGHISVKMAVDDKGTYILAVADNGIGIPEDIDWENPSSLGLQLVSDLVKQVSGTITVKRKNGTAIRIKF